jgi:GcrA cell cycle regulator
MAWTDESIQTLKRLYAAGKSGGDIAAELGSGITRNAVCGKIDRLGLTRDIQPRAGRPPWAKSPPRVAGGFPSTPKHAIKTTTKRETKPSCATLVDASCQPDFSKADDCAAQPGQSAQNSQYLRLLDLQFDSCRWPLGDPRDQAFRFCGATATIGGGSYCAEHHKISVGVK